LSVARMIFQSTGKPNRHAFHDVGQAIASLTVQATAVMQGNIISNGQVVDSGPSVLHP
jgi:hypothetical protein